MRGALAIAAAAVLLAGCASGGGAGGPSTAVAAEPYTGCPDVLVQADPPHHGFGTQDAASSAPDLGVPDSAWVCEYSAQDTGEPDPGGGALYEWRLTTGPVTVADDALAALGDVLARVAVPPAERACTDDLGPRLLLVSVSGDLQVAMTIDDYGCREIRLTEDPWESAPGAPGDPDLPAGVLMTTDGDPAAEVRALSGIGGGR